MEYQEFRTWAEEHGWLLLREGSLHTYRGEMWLTPAGQAVAVRKYETKTGIEIHIQHSDMGFDTSDS